MQQQGYIQLSNYIKEFIVNKYQTIKANIIKSNISEEISQLFLAVKKKEQNNDHDVHQYKDRVFELLYMYEEVALKLGALMMDAYTLSSIFIKYPNAINKKVIIYTGLAHTEIYKEFFEKYLKLDSKMYQSSSKCIQINSVDLL